MLSRTLGVTARQRQRRKLPMGSKHKGRLLQWRQQHMPHIRMGHLL